MVVGSQLLPQIATATRSRRSGRYAPLRIAARFADQTEVVPDRTLGRADVVVGDDYSVVDIAANDLPWHPADLLGAQ